MSLNRSEQQVFEYIEENREERHFWQQKVRGYHATSARDEAAALLIERDLWRYWVERSAVVPEFKQQVERDGLRRVSMRNLSEYLLRIWTEPRPRPKKPPVSM